MPILHVQLGAQQKTPDGKTAAVEPSLALNLRGPIIQVTVTIEQNTGKGKPLPTPKSGLALIDTGAMVTCIDEEAAQELGLPVIDVGKMTSATHKDRSAMFIPCRSFSRQGSL
jgi:hypothetical protein